MFCYSVNKTLILCWFYSIRLSIENFNTLQSIDLYMHVHWKATTKSHRAMKTRDPSLYYLIFIYDGRQPEADIAEILKFQSFENARHAFVEISPYTWKWMRKSSHTEKEGPLLILSLIFCFLIAVSQMQRQVVARKLMANDFSLKSRPSQTTKTKISEKRTDTKHTTTQWSQTKRNPSFYFQCISIFSWLFQTCGDNRSRGS